ncbi:MAG TPA: PVC-type heme-binding CxxCH protein [Pirellulales bacterium]|jgi:putative heme-binding domain-containing protein|nr:PVC-type heme-binding CxxCH protein [Pirellulales bacterium]
MRWIVLSLLVALLPTQPAHAAGFELKKGDHVCIIGNTLADRMQHHGWLETLLQARFPQHELVVRNLGFPGDELTLRLRSAGFGTPDEHLTANKADVIFAFFGYNESFAGEEGVAKFEADLDAFIKSTLTQKYNGSGAPRLVIFSPIAHENLRDRNLPDGSENNDRLRRYTGVMYEVAKNNDVAFVDLFAPSLERYGRAKQPLTTNGVHLHERGDRAVAEAIDEALFGARETDIKPAEIERLRQAVLDKNFIWFNRYRTVDGYSIYGGRADLKFTNGQTNREVMAREMAVLDVMAANRDQRVWAVARGGDLQVDDSNTPPFLEVITNKPGAGPNGQHLYQSGEAAIANTTLAKGLKVNLFASEEMFPELAKPVQMAFDTRGRLWVAVMPSYPHWKPKDNLDDKILILEDTDGDGRADRCKTFAHGLHVPTGIEFFRDGLLVGQQPDLVLLRDTDGDDVADTRERVLDGLDSADTHHALNSFVLDPGGALYFQEGTFHHTQVESPWGPAIHNVNAGVYRYEPRTQKFEVYVPSGFANPHGHVFDHWGQDFITDGTGNVNYWAAAFSGHLEYPAKHPRMEPFYKQRSRPSPGTEIISSRHFPPEMQGNYLDANVISFQGIFQYKFRDDGAGFGADEVEPLLSSSDPNFRPADMEIGPDGALYFLDWQNAIIGHMQHNLRDPSRDSTHGRVYRVTYEGRPLLKPAKIAGEPIEKLLDLLKEPEDRVRYRVKIELGGRPSDEVVAAAAKWAAALDKNDPEYQHHLLEALWVHQYHNVVNVDLLGRLLASPDYRARAAATRVLCYWHDRVPETLAWLRRLAADEHPRVRLEAVRAASFFTVPEAIEVAAISADYPSDYWLGYCRTETNRALEPYVKASIAAGRRIPMATEAGERYMLGMMSLDQLLKLERSRPVYQELLLRPGLRDEQRRDALAGLAAMEKKSELALLLETIRKIDSGYRPDESLVFDLVRLLASRPADELRGVRSDLEALATGAKQDTIRQAGYVALVTVDGSVEAAWALATTSVDRLLDLVAAMPLVFDASLRAELYPKVLPLLKGLPEPMASSVKPAPIEGRYVRIELPGDATLTLAEVEVYSHGKNIARKGKASQKNTSHGGIASRAIDGNKDGTFGAGGQTHTEESTNKPWWELDLGEDREIDSIVIYNRTEGGFWTRLNNFRLTVLDSRGRQAFRADKNKAPEGSVEFSPGGEDATALVRRAAMMALASVRGQELNTFRTLATFVHDGVDRPTAVRAMQRIGRQFWPADEARPLVDVLLADIRSTPVKARTSETALAELEFAEALAGLLPADQAKAVRGQLGELGVRVIRVGTLLERMSYDKDLLVLRAGKPVEFVFENSDFMPHNFVIAQPGALEEIGTTAEASAQDPAFAKRNFVPSSKKILLGSKLLQPRESQKLSFIAPKTPGVYPYVCTYPGHWRRMYGAMYVVDDVDAYLANPEAYLVSHPLEIKDALLKDRRPRTEWKLDDLAQPVTALAGRSWGNGKQMFQAATCVACHKLDGVGNTFGPDLAKLDPAKKPLDILTDILDPSAKINEKFQTYVFQTSDGKVITGIILEETPSRLRVIENPLAKAEPVVLKKSDIDEQTKSPVSIMPKGLLDKLTKDEILDLVAYLAARGDKHSPLVSGPAGHEHAGH